MATNPHFPDAAPWPEGQPAPVGHNKPPVEEQVKAEFQDVLLAERPDFLVKRQELIESADRAQATNDEELGRCGNLVKALRAVLSHVDATHKTVKQPYLDGGRAADAEKKALVGEVEDAKRKVEGIGNAFVAQKEAAARAERQRIEDEQRRAAQAAADAERKREQAEREAQAAADAATTKRERDAAEKRREKANAAAEAAMKAASLAPATPAAPEPVRSDEGATVSGKKEWKSEVTDYELAFMSVSDDENVQVAIDKAVARRVKAGTRKIEGVKIWPVAKANFR